MFYIIKWLYHSSYKHQLNKEFWHFIRLTDEKLVELSESKPQDGNLYFKLHLLRIILEKVWKVFRSLPQHLIRKLYYTWGFPLIVEELLREFEIPDVDLRKYYAKDLYISTDAIKKIKLRKIEKLYNSSEEELYNTFISLEKQCHHFDKPDPINDLKESAFKDWELKELEREVEEGWIRIFSEIEQKHKNQPEAIFHINEYLTLKLEDGYTDIYVGDELFDQCKYLLLNIPIENIEDYEEVESIDEAAEMLDNSLEPTFNDQDQLENEQLISPEMEFWGHCSNLQAWYEHDYDTRLLHSNLSFPLLRKLSKVGDVVARKVYKEEIATRFGSGFLNVMLFLIEGKYMEEFEEEELEVFIDDPQSPANITLKNALIMSNAEEQKHIIKFYRLVGDKGYDLLMNEFSTYSFFLSIEVLGRLVIDLEDELPEDIYHLFLKKEMKVICENLLVRLSRNMLKSKKDLGISLRLLTLLFSLVFKSEDRYVNSDIFYSFLDLYYYERGCEIDFEPHCESIVNYKVRPKGKSYYLDDPHLTIRDWESGGALNELSTMFFPVEPILIDQVLQPEVYSNQFEFKVWKLTQKNHSLTYYNDCVKTMVKRNFNYDSLIEFRSLLSGEQIYILYKCIISLLQHKNKDREIRFIDCESFMKILTKYYTKKNCEVEFELEPSLGNSERELSLVKYRLIPHNTLFSYNLLDEVDDSGRYYKALKELKDIFFPKEQIYIEKIEQLFFEFEPIRFYIKKLET